MKYVYESIIKVKICQKYDLFKFIHILLHIHVYKKNTSNLYTQCYTVHKRVKPKVTATLSGVEGFHYSD